MLYGGIDPDSENGDVDAITDDLRQIVGRNAFDAGLRYQVDGRVQKVRVEPGGVIAARVRGTALPPYRQ